ncbi:unnamed protein product [Paramecium octaurelia]|uniref:Uncharacterized protein n=1 Tax=Paramecium octaurelia TaxID=43137 RepID=A0A8S1U238_PAROT|nr:unnamed protein product [Paramecium octaurelia]CAD8158043.1 unnamed protein product [Paramecium octaurelia]
MGSIDGALYDIEIWKRNQYGLAERLISLNKVMASVEEVGPIMVQKQQVKFMEWIYVQTLKKLIQNENIFQLFFKKLNRFSTTLIFRIYLCNLKMKQNRQKNIN